MAYFCLVLFLFVYHLKFHPDVALGDQTSAKVEANNYSIEKGKTRKARETAADVDGSMQQSLLKKNSAQRKRRKRKPLHLIQRLNRKGSKYTLKGSKQEQTNQIELQFPRVLPA